ncbi:MAG: ABC transporter ATP-binding protein [Anaerolineae bacterium]|nr:ABC transporter ATP-binding protein [Anaerolineae bacterium]
MASVRVENVVKRYESAALIRADRGRPALDRVNLSIADGETVSVVGPSGCGKSTLLKVIAGLEYPNEGRVYYNDHDVTEVKPQHRGVGMVFQDYALYPSREGEGNLRYYFEVRRRSEEEKQERLRATAELMGVGFELLLGRMPDTLSGGEKQRVGIARCIVRDPNVFLMDEPISNLDAKLRERTRTEIRRLLQRFRITTLYVTHDQQEAIFMADRIAVMREGRIEQFGTFDELYYAPANLFVATFIGSPPISLVPGRVAGGSLAVEGGAASGPGESAWPLPPTLAAALPAGPVRLGVRPEGWQVAEEGAEGLPIEVSHVERLYTERAAFLYGRLGGALIIALVPLDYREAAEVRLRPDWDRAYFFAPEGEEALRVPGVPELF